MRTAIYDLETTNLNPGIGHVLVGSVFSVPQNKMHTFCVDPSKPWDDRVVIKGVRDVLNAHDLIVGYYSKGFDNPFLSTRLAKHRMNPLKRKFHCDIYWYYKGWRGLKPRRASLAVVAEFWGLKEEKFEVDPEFWQRAQAGDKAALKVLMKRCESDVRLTEEVYWKTLDAGLVQRVERYP